MFGVIFLSKLVSVPHSYHEIVSSISELNVLNEQPLLSDNLTKNELYNFFIFELNSKRYREIRKCPPFRLLSPAAKGTTANSPGTRLADFKDHNCNNNNISPFSKHFSVHSLFFIVLKVPGGQCAYSAWLHLTHLRLTTGGLFPRQKENTREGAQPGQRGCRGGLISPQSFHLS